MDWFGRRDYKKALKDAEKNVVKASDAIEKVKKKKISSIYTKSDLEDFKEHLWELKKVKVMYEKLRVRYKHDTKKLLQISDDWADLMNLVVEEINYGEFAFELGDFDKYHATWDETRKRFKNLLGKKKWRDPGIGVENLEDEFIDDGGDTVVIHRRSDKISNGFEFFDGVTHSNFKARCH